MQHWNGLVNNSAKTRYIPTNPNVNGDVQKKHTHEHKNMAKRNKTKMEQ